MKNELLTDYWAFISYRHLDNQQQGRQWATWLHQQLESYEIPESLVGTRNNRGDLIPERFFPIFRDEEELPADADLSTAIEAAAKKSKYMIVLCSPRAVESNYIAEEILLFKKLGRENRIIAVLIDGEPNASWDTGKQKAGFSPYHECFPKPLTHPLLETGELDESKHTEPLAADLRLPSTRQQGWTNPAAYRQDLAAQGTYKTKAIRDQVKQYEEHLETGVLKVIAGTLGVGLETLRRRGKAHELAKARRRARTLTILLILFASLSLIAVAAGIFGRQQMLVAQEQMAEAKKQEQLAVEQKKQADNRYWEFRREQISRKNRDGRELGFRQILAAAIEAKLSDFDSVLEGERKERIDFIRKVAQDIRQQKYSLSDHRKPQVGSTSEALDLDLSLEKAKKAPLAKPESEKAARNIRKPEFIIPRELEENDPELVILIKQTESMDNDERQYWFDLWPIMTPRQRDRIKDILLTERKKLIALELKYQNEIRALNVKHTAELAMVFRKQFNSEDPDTILKLVQGLNAILENDKTFKVYAEFIHGEIIEYLDYLYAWTRFQNSQPDQAWFAELKKFNKVNWLPENVITELTGNHAGELYANMAFFYRNTDSSEEFYHLIRTGITLGQSEKFSQWRETWKSLFLNAKQEDDLNQLWNIGWTGTILLKSEKEPVMRQYYYDGTLDVITRRREQIELEDDNAQKMHSIWGDISSIHSAYDQWDQSIAAGKKSLDYALRIEGNAGKSRQCGNYLNLSWYSLFKGDYQAAIQYAQTGLEIDVEYRALEINLAHALWMSGEKEKAKQLYLGNRGLFIDKSKWENVILDDFQTFRMRGIFPEDLNKVALQLTEDKK